MTAVFATPPSARPEDFDPRLAPYRERGGRLYRADGSFVADVFVQTRVWWAQKGRLWWRQFHSPQEIPESYVLEPGEDYTYDVIYVGDLLAEALQEWPEGRFTHRGEQLVVEWLDDRQSRETRERLHLAPVAY